MNCEICGAIDGVFDGDDAAPGPPSVRERTLVGSHQSLCCHRCEERVYDRTLGTVEMNEYMAKDLACAHYASGGTFGTTNTILTCVGLVKERSEALRCLRHRVKVIVKELQQEASDE